MAGYYKQCGCGRHADVIPCYDCLELENNLLKELLEYVVAGNKSCREWTDDRMKPEGSRRNFEGRRK